MGHSRSKEGRQRPPRGVGIAMCVVLMAGCSQPLVPPDQFYRLYAGSVSEPSATPRLDGVLVVRPFLGDGLVSERPLIYGDGESAANPLQQYHYHHWTESPTRMLQELTVTHLRDANVATQVVTPEISIDAGYELLGKIKRFEQLLGASPRVVVELEFSLSSSRDARLLWTQDYAVEVDCKDASVTAAVAAFSEAIDQIYARLIDDVRAS